MSPKAETPRCDLDEAEASGFPDDKIFCVRGVVKAKFVKNAGIGCKVELLNGKVIVIPGFFSMVRSLHDVQTEAALSGEELEVGYYPQGWGDDYKMDCQIETKRMVRVLYVGVLRRASET